MIKGNAQKNRDNFNRRANPQAYEVGDLVFLRAKYDANSNLGKFQPKYEGPYRVEQLRDHKVLVRSVNLRQPVEHEVHKDDLRRCYEVVEEQVFHNVAPPRRGPGRPRKVPPTP
jgi:hypothetical protein